MKKRKQPTQSQASKVFCFIIMLTAIIGFFWLAFYSQAYHESKYLSEADIIAIIEAKKAESIQPKQVKLWKPRNEAERQRVISELWGIKGHKDELKIFTARK